MSTSTAAGTAALSASAADGDSILVSATRDGAPAPPPEGAESAPRTRVKQSAPMSINVSMFMAVGGVAQWLESQSFAGDASLVHFGRTMLS